MRVLIFSILISYLMLISNVSHSQGVTWTFNTGTDGWSLGNSLTGSVSGGTYNLTITGLDPYMFSPNSLGLNAANNIKFTIKVKNVTNDASFQIFWVTNGDGAWNQQKSYTFDVVPNDNQIREYTFIVASKSTWSGTIKQIRLDPGNTVSSGSVQIDEISITPYDFSLDNGTIKIKQDLTRGGAINYISASSNTTNIVNIYDEGRYIQQSYYAGHNVNRQAEGQNPAWSPWAWNPIQVGDSYLNRAEILDFNKSGDTMYVKCIPKQWDMNNMAAQATMEQWTILQGNVIKVINKLTCFRTDNIYGEGYHLDQELPAVYPISALNNLYSYTGNAPFTNEPVENLPVVELYSNGFWGIYDDAYGNAPSEKWMAFVNNSLWGLGVYTPTAGKFLAGRAGSAGGNATSVNTSYISPTKKVILNKNSVFEYEYFLIVGNLDDIRSNIYTLAGVTTGPVAGVVSAALSTVCVNQSTTLNITGAYEGTIQWQSSTDNAIWSDISGANAETISSGNMTVNKYFRAKFTSGSSDEFSNVVQITVNSLPDAAGSISGNTTVCQGENAVTYTVPTIANATTYEWTLPTGATGSSTSNSITVDFDNTATSGNIIVNGVNTCGNGNTSTLAITVNSLPDAAGSISGNTSVCMGETTVTYTVPTIANATTYEWTLPTGATGSSTSNSITVDFDNTATSGNIIVNGVNTCGNGTTSTLAITVGSLPEAAGSISGNTTVCQGENAVTYTVPTIANATTYEWTLPTGATGSSTSNSITVDFDNTATSGNIIVNGVNTCGEGTSSDFAVTVNPTPETPIITLTGNNVLQSDAPNGNQWYYDNGSIAAATGQLYTVTETGTYYSIVTLSGCSSDTSNHIYVLVTGMETNQANYSLLVYPNPVADELSIDIGKNHIASTLELINVLGQTVVKQAFYGQTLVSTQHLPVGIYVVRVENNLGVNMVKIIKK